MSIAGDSLLFRGSANAALGAAVARELGTPPGACSIERFPDGEVHVELLESVRRKDVYFLQPLSPPVDEHFVELLAFADACRRAAAARVTVIVPYLGYARSDKRSSGHREPIAASMVAMCLQAVGIDQLVTLDLHAAQIEGFFRIPVDTLSAAPTLCSVLKERLPDGVVVVSPDAGRVAAATEYARHLDASVVILHKHRESGTETSVTRVVGDVRERPCLIIDDMISTGGTLERSVEALLAAGAEPWITVAVTHGLFVGGDALERLIGAGIDTIYVTDSVPPPAAHGPQLQVVSIAPMLADTIRHLVCSSNGSAAVTVTTRAQRSSSSENPNEMLRRHVGWIGEL